MKIYISFFIYLTLFIGEVKLGYGQKQIELINSSEIIEEGLTYTKEGNYQKAIDTYSRISRNDSNYAASLVEISVACIHDKQYQKSLETSLHGLTLKSSYGNLFYNMCGVSLKNLQKLDEAEKYFKEGLSKFANDQYLYYNLGEVYQKQGKNDLAIKQYQNAIITNPYNSSAHYKLGLIYAINEKPVQAMMAFQMSLVIDPSNEVSDNVLKALEETVNNLLPPAEDKEKANLPKDVFEELEVLIKSKISLNKNYKNKTKLNYVAPRQIQLFLEKFIYEENSKDFFMQFYGPYYQAVKNENLLEPLVYVAYASANNEDVQKVVKKNLSKIQSFLTWSYKNINGQRKFRPLVAEDINGKLGHYYFTNNRLQAVGNFKEATEVTRVGEWVFYYSNGVVSKKMNYDETGKVFGEALSFFDNGSLSGIENYRNGLAHGLCKYYYLNGTKKVEINMMDGNAEGDVKYYYPSGALQKVIAVVSNEKQGLEMTFYGSGVKETEGNYVKGKRDGEYRVYYETGELKEIINFKNDLRDGLNKEYFENGTLMVEGNFKIGNPVGDWKVFTDSGKLIKEGKYNDLGNQFCGKNIKMMEVLY
jgi:antitoxin component YwqK of YwqJK toxin-antitoxin module/Tfp pilus assembly protein PilF